MHAPCREQKTTSRFYSLLRRNLEALVHGAGRSVCTEATSTAAEAELTCPYSPEQCKRLCILAHTQRAGHLAPSAAEVAGFIANFTTTCHFRCPHREELPAELSSSQHSRKTYLCAVGLPLASSSMPKDHGENNPRGQHGSYTQLHTSSHLDTPPRYWTNLHRETTLPVTGAATQFNTFNRPSPPGLPKSLVHNHPRNWCVALLSQEKVALPPCTSCSPRTTTPAFPWNYIIMGKTGFGGPSFPWSRAKPVLSMFV